MSEKIPRRKISDVKIPNKVKEELQIVSKITGMLAEKPELLEHIGTKMQEVSKEYEMKMKQEVSNIIASAIDVKVDKIIDICPQIIRYIDYWDHVWIPRIWWLWGPYEHLNPQRDIRRG